MGHEFCDDVDRLISADRVEFDEFRVAEVLHDFRLFEEVVLGHCARFQRLYRHIGRAVPFSWRAERKS